VNLAWTFRSGTCTVCYPTDLQNAKVGGRQKALVSTGLQKVYARGRVLEMPLPGQLIIRRKKRGTVTPGSQLVFERTFPEAMAQRGKSTEKEAAEKRRHV